MFLGYDPDLLVYLEPDQSWTTSAKPEQDNLYEWKLEGGPQATEDISFHSHITPILPECRDQTDLPFAFSGYSYCPFKAIYFIHSSFLKISGAYAKFH